MKQELIPFGSDIKIIVDITDLGENLTLEGIAYKLIFTSGDKSKTFETTVAGSPAVQTLASGLTKVTGNADRVIASIPAADLDRGSLYLRAELSIPDASFTGGVRKEVVVKDTHITIN